MMLLLWTVQKPGVKIGKNKVFHLNWLIFFRIPMDTRLCLLSALTNCETEIKTEVKNTKSLAILFWKSTSYIWKFLCSLLSWSFNSKTYISPSPLFLQAHRPESLGNNSMWFQLGLKTLIFLFVTTGFGTIPAASTPGLTLSSTYSTAFSFITTP
jgi:hypothetical protein